MMKKKEYISMIDDAISEFVGCDANYVGILNCLKYTATISKKSYVTKVDEIKARERIDTLKRLKNLNLLK